RRTLSTFIGCRRPGPNERRGRTGRAFRRSDGPPSRPTAPSDRKGMGLPRDEPRPKRGHGESASLGARAERLGPGTVGPGFNFAFADAGSEPSGGHADEIADLREAMGYARTTAGLDTVFVAGRGLGAWAAVAAATDELCAGAVLLGLSYRDNRNGGWPWSASRSSRSTPWSWWD